MASRLYGDLAAWWPLFAPTGYYEGEARSIMAMLDALYGVRPRRILELGSGGGCMAAYFDGYAELTLLDCEEAMLGVSRRTNPAARHVNADMRSARLDTQFDAVIIHDAINHISRSSDLLATLMTARLHLAPNGVAIVLPDDTAETFRPCVSMGGQDGAEGRSLRYLAWTQPAENNTYRVDFAIMCRAADGVIETVHESFDFGLFSRTAWRTAFLTAGFTKVMLRADAWRQDVFVARAG
jgi:SAM-dependent methyltransferase